MYVSVTWKLKQLSFDTVADESCRELWTLSGFPAAIDTFDHNQCTTSNLFRHSSVTKQSTRSLYNDMNQKP